MLHSILGVGLQARPNDLTEQGNVGAVHLKGYVVEDAEVRQHQQFMSDLFDNPLLGLGGGLSALSVLGRA